MSSILNALKKLEQEKSGRSPDSLKIDSDILKTSEPIRKTSPVVSGILLILVFGGGVAMTLFFMRGDRVTQTTVSLPAARTAADTPSSPLPVLRTETLPAEIVVVPAQQEKPEKKPLTVKKSVLPAVKAVPKTVTVTRPAAAAAPVRVKQHAVQAEKQEPAAVKSPVLRVNGIAFQNSSADSMAIVNGVPVSNGSIIEGVTVKEIRKDRILFQHNGGAFEIQLGQSNQ